MKKIIFMITVIFWALAGYCSDFSSFKTDSGQNVIIQEVHDNPIVIIDTWIKTGSINETDENNGVAHFLEHLFFKGTSKHPAKEFDRILESKGAETNAATSKDYTHYYILIPSKYFDTALDLHADMLMNPLIPRKELEKERKVVIEEISKNNDKPTTVLYRNMIKGFYKNHPYKRDVIGTKNVIETISREQILDFYNTWYTPQNMTTVIIGDINTQKALNAVKSSFNKTAECSRKQKQNIYKTDKRPDKSIQTMEKLNVQTGYILIGFKGVHPINTKDSYALDVLATILGDGKSSRLYKELKEQKQLVHSVSASHSSMKDDSIFYISANYDSCDFERIKQAVFEEINKLQTNEIPGDEIKKAKNIIERDTFYSRESVSNIAAEIGYTVTLTGDTSYYKNYIDNINKVTASDLKRVAKEYLNREYSVISIIQPENFDKNTVKISEIKKVHHNAIRAGKNCDTVKYLLENGATLIITNNNANDIVAIEVSSRGGNNLERTPGVAALTADVMKKATKKYSKSDLSSILEENGIEIKTYAGGDSFAASAKFTKNEKDVALDIFNEIINNALIDDYDFEKSKNDMLTSVKNIKNTPDSLAFDEYKTALRANTPFGNSGKVLEKTLPGITQADIENFYKNLFPAQNTVISINGNVNAQEYIDYFSEILKNDNTKPINIADYKSKYKPLTQNKTVKVPMDSQSSWLIFGWLTDGSDNEKDWAALRVINAILGSGMSSRLFTELRDDMGLAYQVGSSYSASQNSGAFTVYIATSPATAQTAKNGILKEIEKLKREFVTDNELSEAKDKLCGNFVLSMETNMDKASTVNALEVNGRGYRFVDKFPELINSVTVQDVIQTANKYFSKPYVFTVVGPQKSIEKL